MFFTRLGKKKTFALFILSRAVNNEVLDTYQLKSLDGLAEARLEDVVITKQEERGRKRSGVKNPETRDKFFLNLRQFKQNGDEGKGSDDPRDELPDHIDNFSLRKPYDRVIRCLGFRFNFSIFDRYRSGEPGFLEYLSIYS